MYERRSAQQIISMSSSNEFGTGFTIPYTALAQCLQDLPESQGDVLEPSFSQTFPSCQEKPRGQSVVRA